MSECLVLFCYMGVCMTVWQDCFQHKFILNKKSTNRWFYFESLVHNYCNYLILYNKYFFIPYYQNEKLSLNIASCRNEYLKTEIYVGMSINLQYPPKVWRQPDIFLLLSITTLCSIKCNKSYACLNNLI